MLDPIKSGIAINAAERTDSDCAEKIPFQYVTPMRPIYLGTTAAWTESFGVRFISYTTSAIAVFKD